MTAVNLHIESAAAEHVPVILELIRGLAEYEKLTHEVVATEESLRDTLFGQERGAEVVIAWSGAEAVGFAVFFHNYSTFLARSGIYLEDLFVKPQWRGRGCGRALLEHVASLAVGRGCGRLEWSVLDWNEPAIGFYRSIGAQALDEWTVFRLTGETLQRFGSGSRSED